MEFLSFQSLSFAEFEADIVGLWSSQHHLDYCSFEQFIQFVRDANEWVEFIFELASKFEVSPRAKYACIYYLFRYTKELERDLAKQQYVVYFISTIYCYDL